MQGVGGGARGPGGRGGDRRRPERNWNVFAQQGRLSEELCFGGVVRKG